MNTVIYEGWFQNTLPLLEIFVEIYGLCGASLCSFNASFYYPEEPSFFCDERKCRYIVDPSRWNNFDFIRKR